MGHWNQASFSDCSLHALILGLGRCHREHSLSSFWVRLLFGEPLGVVGPGSQKVVSKSYLPSLGPRWIVCTNSVIYGESLGSCDITLTSGRTETKVSMWVVSHVYMTNPQENPGQPGQVSFPDWQHSVHTLQPIVAGEVKVVHYQLPGTAQLDTHAWSLWDPVLCGSSLC